MLSEYSVSTHRNSWCRSPSVGWLILNGRAARMSIESAVTVRPILGRLGISSTLSVYIDMYLLIVQERKYSSVVSASTESFPSGVLFCYKRCIFNPAGPRAIGRPCTAQAIRNVVLNELLPKRYRLVPLSAEHGAFRRRQFSAPVLPGRPCPGRTAR